MNAEKRREGWTRRQALGALLAAGLWPGTLRAAASAPAAPVGAEFTFAVANDFHHEGAACDAWFARLFGQMAERGDVAFCAALGDFAHRGRPASMIAVRAAAAGAGIALYPVPGNHDNDLEGSTRLYAQVFPDRLNSAWTHEGWQFLALDTTDGKKWADGRVPAATLEWLEATVPTLDPRRPTVVFTHFPLAPSRGVFPLTALRRVVPVNAEAVLAHLVPLNLRGVFSGHYHGRTRTQRGAVELVTGVCCSRVAKNHDGDAAKGTWRCRAYPDGRLEREFALFAVDGADVHRE